MGFKVSRILLPQFPEAERALDDMANEIEFAGNLSGVHPIKVDKGSAGPVVSLAGESYKVVVINSSAATSGSYNCVEVIEGTSGTWVTKSGGWTGVAWEFNLTVLDLTPPVYVEIEYFKYADEWRFQYGGCPA